MKINKVRDLTLVNINKEKKLVIACDSCGSIGMKKYDELKVPTNVVGKFTARVALMEVICSGAEVITLSNAVCNEMEPTGEQVIKGITSELKAAGINDSVLTGSTEENFKTYSTGIGITCIGIVDNENIKINKVEKGAFLYSIGIPKVGNEINLDGDLEIANYKNIKDLLNTKDVLEIVPVGSKGISYEAHEMAKYNNLKIKFEENINIDIFKSAGPATVIIFAIKNKIENLENVKNLNLIGKFI